FSSDHGLFVFAPVALIALISWPFSIRQRPRESYVIGAGFLLYFLVMGSYAIWSGGDCYGPRYLVPVIPLLMVPLGLALAWAVRNSRSALFGMMLVCGLSLGINVVASIDYCRSFRWRPFTSIWKALHTVPVGAALLPPES